MLKQLFIPKNLCPKCNKILHIETTRWFFARVIQKCPDGHYTKEYHPALETAVEIIKE